MNATDMEVNLEDFFHQKQSFPRRSQGNQQKNPTDIGHDIPKLRTQRKKKNVLRARIKT